MIALCIYIYIPAINLITNIQSKGEWGISFRFLDV